MTTTTTTLGELPALKGAGLGTSDWIEVTQDRVNLFADATDDHQWIHVDVERSKAESPFGEPVVGPRRRPGHLVGCQARNIAHDQPYSLPPVVGNTPPAPHRGTGAPDLDPSLAAQIRYACITACRRDSGEG